METLRAHGIAVAAAASPNDYLLVDDDGCCCGGDIGCARGHRRNHYGDGDDDADAHCSMGCGHTTVAADDGCYCYRPFQHAGGAAAAEDQLQ